MILPRQKMYTAAATKQAVMKAAGFKPGMAKSILNGSLGKAEGQMMGGYGKWSRDLVARSNSAKMASMTHPQKMVAKRKLG